MNYENKLVKLTCLKTIPIRKIISEIFGLLNVFEKFEKDLCGLFIEAEDEFYHNIFILFALTKWIERLENFTSQGDGRYRFSVDNENIEIHFGTEEGMPVVELVRANSDMMVNNNAILLTEIKKDNLDTLLSRTPTKIKEKIRSLWTIDNAIFVETTSAADIDEIIVINRLRYNIKTSYYKAQITYKHTTKNDKSTQTIESGSRDLNEVPTGILETNRTVDLMRIGQFSNDNIFPHLTSDMWGIAIYRESAREEFGTPEIINRIEEELSMDTI
jgi:hypothetical protein